MKIQSAITTVISILILLAIPLSAFTEEKPVKTEKLRLAVMDLNAKGKVSKVTANAISDLLRSDIVDTARFVIVERSQMESIFKEQGLQMAGCTDNSCAVEIGKLLSANKIILGEVNQLNSNLMITVRVVDVSKGVAEFSTSEKTVNINEIDKTVKTLVEKLTLRMTGKRPVEDYERPAGYYLRGIVPGWAQVYADNGVKGWSFAAVTLAAAGYTGWAIYDYTGKKKKYDDLGPGTTAAEFKSKYNAKKDAAVMATIGIYALAGIYAINWIDVIFFNKYQPENTAMIDYYDSSDYFFSVNTLQDIPCIKEKSFGLGFNLRF